MSKAAAAKAKERTQNWEFSNLPDHEKAAVVALIAGGGVAGIAGVDKLAQTAIPSYGDYRVKEAANMEVWTNWVQEQQAAGVPMEVYMEGGFNAAPIPYPEIY